MDSTLNALLESIKKNPQTAIKGTDAMALLEAAVKEGIALPPQALQAASEEISEAMPAGWTLTFEDYFGRVRAIARKQ